MAESQGSGKVRLFQKSLRAPQVLTKPQTSEKPELPPSASLATFLHRRDVPKPLLPARSKALQFKVVRTPSNDKAARSTHHSPSAKRLRLKKHVNKAEASFVVAQSLGESFTASRDDSPNATLEAINLELSLTTALEEVERLPSGIRQQRRLQAYLDALAETAAVDSVYGRLLAKVKKELEKSLRAAKLGTVEDLQLQNAKLSSSLSELKQLGKSEKDEHLARDRVYENLAKENALLQKKIEELELMLKKNASRVPVRKQELPLEHVISELKVKTKKIKELDEEVRAARIREAKLTDLLNWMQADTDRSAVMGTEEGVKTYSVRVRDRRFSRNKLVPSLDIPATESSEDGSPEEISPSNKGLEESTSSSAPIPNTPVEDHVAQSAKVV